MNIINNTEVPLVKRLMEDVFSRIKDNDTYGLNSEIVLDEFDNSRVYFTTNGNEENTLRIWDVINCNTSYKMRWSLFCGNKQVKDGTSKVKMD